MQEELSANNKEEYDARFQYLIELGNDREELKGRLLCDARKPDLFI